MNFFELLGMIWAGSLTLTAISIPIILLIINAANNKAMDELPETGIDILYCNGSMLPSLYCSTPMSKLTFSIEGDLPACNHITDDTFEIRINTGISAQNYIFTNHSEFFWTLEDIGMNDKGIHGIKMRANVAFCKESVYLREATKQYVPFENLIVFTIADNYDVRIKCITDLGNVITINSGSIDILNTNSFNYWYKRPMCALLIRLSGLNHEAFFNKYINPILTNKDRKRLKKVFAPI